MNLFNLYAKISLDTGEYDKGVQSAMKSAKNLASHIGSGIKSAASTGGSALKTLGTAAVNVGSTIGTAVSNIAKVGTAAVGVASAGVVALTKTALDNYAEYEQLVGGVETLFGDSAKTVQGYALNAYKTAGMNANEYMETVTSFSASLLQSLDNDTAAAAQKADMAITDMSDNANKMGTDISMIQNAYQGFAKQNYTMLDNLKLGYGGTKEEMQRLLEDAEKISGIEYDISSYADVVDAIHVIQTEMGITGTTSKEASSTISGSIASMKSSWQNLVGALGSDTADLEYFIDAFVESTKTAAGNVLPVVKTILRGVSSLVSELAPVIVDAIPMLVTDVVPSLMLAGVSILEALVNGLMQAVPELVEKAPELIKQFLSAIGQLAGTVWDAGATLISEFGAGLVEIGESVLVDGAESLIVLLGEKLGASDETINSALEVVQTAWDTASEIFESIKEAIETVATSISDTGITWGDVWTGISEALTIAGELIGSGIELIGAAVAWLVEEMNTDGSLINVIWENIKTTIDTTVAVIQGIITTFLAVFNGDWSAAWESAKETLGSLWDGMSSIVSDQMEWIESVVSDGLEAIKGWFSEKLEAAKQTVTDVFDSVYTTISDKITLAKDTVYSAIEAIKGFFDFQFSWPNLPLPHFSISPSGWSIGDLLQGSIPSLSVSWYKKAMDNPMLLDGATIFGMAGNTLLGGGEAGPEVVSGADTLMSMIHEASNAGNEALLDVMLDILELLTGFFPEVLNLLERGEGGVDLEALTRRIDERLGRIYRRRLREA